MWFNGSKTTFKKGDFTLKSDFWHHQQVQKIRKDIAIGSWSWGGYALLDWEYILHLLLSPLCPVVTSIHSFMTFTPSPHRVYPWWVVLVSSAVWNCNQSRSGMHQFLCYWQKVFSSKHINGPYQLVSPSFHPFPPISTTHFIHGQWQSFDLQFQSQENMNGSMYNIYKKAPCFTPDMLSALYKG
jgi:hypothetical protein